MQNYKQLSIQEPSKLIFGNAPHPLTTRRGLIIGGGQVYPELNFTVPPMTIDDATFPNIKKMYKSIITEACQRAVDLGIEGFVAEFETLLEMTQNPAYAVELTKIMNEVMDDYYEKYGLKSALRITPNDLREMERPQRMRSGPLVEKMLETFQGCAEAGGEMLSIESTGGKEIHDDALLSGDIAQVIFSLAVLGVRDMKFLWKKIVDIAAETETTAGGDTACGFGNTAMILAERRNIPKVFAAVVRTVSTVRSLVAYEMGAIGPGKDCGYENVFLKAITGLPMSMEGKTAACAHLSPLGNIASATCDLWSNESVQNIKLLGGMAPTVYFEQLSYDCRLMNIALRENQGEVLKKLFVRSDAHLDPQALILTPENAIRISKKLVESAGYYEAAKEVALCTIDIIRDGMANQSIRLSDREIPYLDMMHDTILTLPDSEQTFIDRMIPTLERSKILLSEYGFE